MCVKKKKNIFNALQKLTIINKRNRRKIKGKTAYWQHLIYKVYKVTLTHTRTHTSTTHTHKQTHTTMRNIQNILYA